MAHGRDQIDYISAACASDGTVLALKGRLLADLGAYLYFGTAEIPTLTTLMGTGPYLFTDIQYDLYGVFTNKVPTDAFRGAGRPEATYFQERMMDAIADDLGLDPAEVRKRNFIKPDQFPYETPLGLKYDSGDYAATLDKALEVSGLPAAQGGGRRVAQAGQTARRRLRQLRRDLRLRTIQDHGRRRLRKRHRASGAERQADHLHRRLSPRAGPRDGVRADRRRHARDRHRRCHLAARRHSQLAVFQQRHRRQPLAGARRQRTATGDGGRP